MDRTFSLSQKSRPSSLDVSLGEKRSDENQSNKFSDFSQLIDELSSQSASRRRIAVVWPVDAHTQEAVAEALRLGLADAVFVGGREAVESSLCLQDYRDYWTVVDATDADDASAKAVGLVREGGADVLMKGLVNTDNLLRAVLNKETGILPKGHILTHITCALLPGRGKFLFFTDPAVIPYPTSEQRMEQVRYLVRTCRTMGVEVPRVALIHCTEKVNEKHFPFTVNYREIAAKASEGAFGPCIVDGPLDVKTSVDADAMRTKGINSPIEGQADALIFPDIVSANVFYKSISLFPGVETAAMLVGTDVPVVLTSRGDSMSTKLFSMAFAAINS